ncbi:MAG TPA: outer membrane beta-barrel protein, partial [Candidatus Sulfotelmatobacter sp.]|nr:outer membrane beta-barrel protein [Candidatus Sulfotelmatobacter sp.]
ALAQTQTWPSQSTPPTVPLYNLPRPDYDQPGIAVGSFLVLPSASEVATYDDNIFASEQSRAGDFVNTTNESIAAASQWSRHSLSGRLYSAQQAYASHGSENANTYGAEGSGRLDITGQSFLQLDGSFVQQPEQRGALQASTNLATRPVFNTTTGRLTYDQSFNYWEERAQASVQDVDFITGGNEFRDGSVYTVRNRVVFKLSEELGAFIEGSNAWQDWDLNPSQRNSDNLTGLIGISAQIPTVIQGELGIGVLRESYSNSAFKPLVTPALTGSLTWNILPLTSIVASAQRTVVGTETFCNAATGICQISSGASTPVVTAFSSQRNTFQSTGGQIGVQHEFWHNILGEANVAYEHDVFDFNGLVDDTYVLSGDVHYLLNRYSEIDFNFAHTQRTANLSADRTFNSGPYTDNIVFLTLKVGL